MSDVFWLVLGFGCWFFYRIVIVGERELRVSDIFLGMLFAMLVTVALKTVLILGGIRSW